MTETLQVVGSLKILKATHHLHLNIRHLSGDLTSSIVLEADSPLGAVHEGNSVTIGGLDGFMVPAGVFSPESRHALGIVRKVSHTFTGGEDDFVHAVIVDIDEIEP